MESPRQYDLQPAISTETPVYRKRVRVEDTSMAYVDVGDAIAYFVAKVLARQISAESRVEPMPRPGARFAALGSSRNLER